MATIFSAQTDWRAFGEYVKERRSKLEMSQAELADLTGRKQPDISAIEKGRKEITLATFCRIAEALRVKPLVLISKALKEE